MRRYLLVDAVREDAFLAFGTVPDEVLIGWPERWTLVRRIGVLAVNRPPVYLAAWEPQAPGDRWRPGWPGAAPGAPAVYEAFGLFMAVPMPVLAVSLFSSHTCASLTRFSAKRKACQGAARKTRPLGEPTDPRGVLPMAASGPRPGSVGRGLPPGEPGGRGRSGGETP